MEQIETEQMETEEQKRPQFLTVLCILTYIGVGLGVIFSILGWWIINKMMPAMEGMEGMESYSEMEGMMSEATLAAIKWIDVTTVVSIAGCLLCLLGALQMWKLKKVGFYIYLVGELGPVIISAILLGSVAFSEWSMIVGAVIALLFVILYALNLKHMK